MALHNGWRMILLATCLLIIGGCGASSSSQDKDSAESEHFLTEQQRALEKSKAAAKTMTDEATERAQQTEDARTD